MSKKNDSKPKGAFYAIPMSSGYTLEISRPSATVAQAVLAKANEEHPYPNPPMGELETVSGVEEYPLCTLDQVSELLRITDPEARKKANDEFLSEFSEDDQKVVKQYIVDLSAANSRQLEYMLDYILKRRATVEGVYGEEARQGLIDAFSEDREELEEYGLVSDSLRELDDWQFVLQVFILADQEDYVLAMAAALDAMSAEVVTDTDVRDRIKSFRRQVAQPTDRRHPAGTRRFQRKQNAMERPAAGCGSGTGQQYVLRGFCGHCAPRKTSDCHRGLAARTDGIRFTGI